MVVREGEEYDEDEQESAQKQGAWGRIRCGSGSELQRHFGRSGFRSQILPFEG